MKEYQSRYPSLGFYVDGVKKEFRFGKYKTSVKEEQVVLETLADVKLVATEEKSEDKKVEEKPKAQAKATAKKTPPKK